MILKPRTTCRICNSTQLSTIMSLGDQHIAAYTPRASDPNPILDKFPLELIRCTEPDCGLVQLRHSTPGNVLYERYFYRSGINKTMTENLKEIAMQAISKVELQDNDIVLDIGCNDGTLLKNYQGKNLRSVGIDPAKNMAEFSKECGADIIVDYFNSKSFTDHYSNEKAKIITSISMFYDLEDPNEFVSDIVNILAKDGVWVIELKYLSTMIFQNAFDNIVHEHIEYYHFSVIEYMLKKHGLKAVDVSLNDSNGGSIRVFVKHANQLVDENSEKHLLDLRSSEKKLNLNTAQPYEEFFQKCKELKSKTMSFIKNEVRNGKKIHAYGASTKGNTILQYYELDNKLIDAIADRNPDKWYRKTIGTNLEIISEEKSRSLKPDYFLILPWHFLEEFREREQDFFKNGGKFIVPLPDFKIIEK
jgi:SAM-dependent methyltransferase